MTGAAAAPASATTTFSWSSLEDESVGLAECEFDVSLISLFGLVARGIAFLKA
jgi:hypothetical protein